MRKYRVVLSIINFFFPKLEWQFLLIDLFEYTDWNITADNIHKFVEFISNISNSIGWHFNGYFMHSQFKFRDWIELQSSEVVQLQPHFKALQSISVLVTDEHDATKSCRQLCSAGQSRSAAFAEWGPTKRECIANIISISSKSNYGDVLIPHFYDEDIDRPNPLFDNFKSISYIQIRKYYPFIANTLNLQLINRESVTIRNFETKYEDFCKLWFDERDIVVRLKVDTLTLFNYKIINEWRILSISKWNESQISNTEN